MTGGAKGIGEATVRLFVQHGAKVVIADVDDALGHALANSLTPSAAFMHCDVRSEDDIKNLVDSTVSTYGHLDIFFNNAGLLGSQTQHKSIVNFDVDEFDRLVSINVRGMALGMKHAARVMIPQGNGCIISTASVAGIMGGLGPNAYTATKHAIVGLTKNVSCELGRYGIKVNCISPSGVVTSMLVNALKGGRGDEVGIGGMSSETGLSSEEVAKMEGYMKRMANLKGPILRAKDIAEAALYLASDESKYVSGHNLVVDGGITSSKDFVGF